MMQKQREQVLNRVDEVNILLQSLTIEDIKEFNSIFHRYAVRFSCEGISQTPIPHLIFMSEVIKIHCEIPYSEWTIIAGASEIAWIVSKIGFDTFLNVKYLETNKNLYKISESETPTINECDSFRHCDDPDCDLGEVQFNCPVCDKINMNYHELWYDGWKITGRKNTMILKCEKCEAELFFFTDEEGNCIYVRKKQDGDVEFKSED